MALAARLVGARVLVGITHLDPAGGVERQEQMFGTVSLADPARGVAVALEGSRAGETHWMPPQTSVLSVAQPGAYRLRSTGEEVVDPDYIANCTVTRRADG